MSFWELTDRETDSIRLGHCPVCNYRGFLLGPRGGIAQNIECASLECRARFNVVRLPDGAICGQRINSEAEGGTDWGHGK